MSDEEILALLRKMPTEEKQELLKLIISLGEVREETSSSQGEERESN